MLYIECFFSGILGFAISQLVILNSMSRKARLSNVEFSLKKYFDDDKFIIIANFLTIIAALLCIKFFVAWRPSWSIFFIPAFFGIGYIGSDLPSRLASVANRRLNAAIDYKTTEIDKLNNTLHTPTPATLPKDKTT